MAQRRKDGTGTPAGRSGRRPYRAPRLVDYGSIPARTLSNASAGSLIDVMLVKNSKKF